jgi:REP element-mobilizing transposase RayT
MNRGADRQRIFFFREDRRHFLDLLGVISEIYGIEIHAFCLMPNHYHLLVCTPEAGLGRAMRHLNAVYAQQLNRRTKRDGPVFRGRYTALLIDSDSYQLQVSRYIHLNPVEAGLADQPEAYSDSSYRAYLARERAPDWLHTGAILGRFHAGSLAAGEYRIFVESGIDAETRAFYNRPRIEPVLGDERFRDRIRRFAEQEERHLDREIPDGRKLNSRPSPAMIVRAVARAFDVAPAKIRFTPGCRTLGLSLPRSVALYLGRHDGGCSLERIASWLGYPSYNTAATAMTRLRARLDEPELRRRLGKARRFLYNVET